MTTILDVVLPVFLLILAGYLAAKRHLVSEDGFKAMTLFVFSLAAPALLFSGGTRPHEGGGGAAAALLAGSLILYGAAVLLGRGVFRMSLADAGIFALTSVFGNSVMMGVPIIVAAFGPPGVPPMLGILALQTLVLLALATVVAEVGLNASASWGRVLRATAMGVLRSPIVLSVALAMIWTTFSLPIPNFVRSTLDLLGGAAPALALFCLGGGLAGIGIAAAWKETAAVVVLKLLLLPLLVWALALLFAIPPIETAVAVTMSALPTGANAFILAHRYATGTDRTGASVVITTALSILTLSALIGYFRGTLP